MKRYFNFVRSFSTVSLVMLYVLTTFFVPFSAAAEEVVRLEIITDPVELNKSLAESFVSEVQISEILETESQSEEETLEEKVSESLKEEAEEVMSEEVEVVVAVEETLTTIAADTTESSEEVVAVVTCTGNAPVITFASEYAETQPGGAGALLTVLSQIGASATDVEDGAIIPTNNLSSLFPLSAGWYEIEYTATDLDGCVTVETVDLFVFGNEYTPACESGFVYMKFDFDSISVTDPAYLGTNSPLFSNQWFPVMYEGNTFNENWSDINPLISHDISIVRSANTVRINISQNITDTIAIEMLVASLEISGGETTEIFSNVSGPAGYNIFISFEPTDCPEPPVCTELNSPLVTTVTDTVTLDANSGLTVEEVITLFGITVVDGDGEGDVTFSHTLTPDDIANEGTYTIVLTAVDNEGCESVYSLTLSVEGEDDNGGGGSTGSGCVNPNGCGGGGNNPPEEESVGEVLGEFSGPTCEYYISTFLKKGANNPIDQVRKLQIFLNDYMGENLVVDGVYGNETFEAVKRFQVREADEVLAPWGITEPTGIVRETTMRHINNIMCPELNIPMPILFCETTWQVIYPEGRDLSWLQTPTEQTNAPVSPDIVTDNFGSYDISDFSK